MFSFSSLGVYKLKQTEEGYLLQMKKTRKRFIVDIECNGWQEQVVVVSKDTIGLYRILKKLYSNVSLMEKENV